MRDDWAVSHATGHTDFEFMGEGLRLRHPTSSRILIKYLHQLQNLFFALTGQELNVTL